jgi:hypothetical protein
MNKYNLLFPSIDGILSDDQLYFEGINRPSKLFLIKDSLHISSSDFDVLEKYLNDVYNLLLRKISHYMSVDKPNEEETIKIQALLQELIKVKEMINGINEAKQKNLV